MTIELCEEGDVPWLAKVEALIAWGDKKRNDAWSNAVDALVHQALAPTRGLVGPQDSRNLESRSRDLCDVHVSKWYDYLDREDIERLIEACPEDCTDRPEESTALELLTKVLEIMSVKSR